MIVLLRLHGRRKTKKYLIKVGYVFLMAVVSVQRHAEFGPDDHREDASHTNM